VTDTPSAESRVAKGVVWLDARMPEWRTNVSLPDFNIRNSCNCVLGQLFGNFDYVLNNDVLRESEAVAFGFDADPYAHIFEDEWVTLQAEWTRVLEATP
jgi:hypothetical protein